MSDQSYFFNPTEDRTALTGVGFQGPRLPTAVRTSLSVSAADAGMTVYDTTLRQLFVWNGTVWKEIKRKLFDPADYGASYSWWAARLESYANGQDVPTWTDHGSGTLTVSAGAGQEPTFYTSTDPVSPNGYPFIRWTNGDRLLNAVTGITGPYTAAIVCRPTALGSTNNVPLIGGAGVSFTSGLKMGSNNGNQTILRTGNVLAIAFTPTNPFGAGYNPISPLGWQVVVGTFDIGSGNQGLTVFKSGLTAAASPNNFIADSNPAGNSNNVAAGAFCLGGNLFVGEIAEAAIWLQTMDNATRVAIGKSLAAQYGISY